MFKVDRGVAGVSIGVTEAGIGVSIQNRVPISRGVFVLADKTVFFPFRLPSLHFKG